jgi:hypothetical protein
MCVANTLFAVSITTGKLVAPALPLIVTDPVVVPVGVELAACENSTLTVHEAPAANVAPQFGALAGKVPVMTREKPAPATARLLIGNGRLLELTLLPLSSVSSSVTGVPTGTVPKSSGAGVTAGSRPLPVSASGEPSITKPAAVTVSDPLTGFRTVGLNTTPSVQLAFAAKLNGAAGQGVAPAEAVANGPLKATAMPVTGTAGLVVLVSVTTCATLVVPTKASPNCSSPVGLTLRSTWTPVPLNATGEPLTALLAVMINDPVTAPAVAGANCTVIVQVAFAFKVNVAVAGQEPPATPAGREKPEAGIPAREMPVKAALLGAVRVNVCVGAEPAAKFNRTFPNVSALGATDATAPEVSCTAPMSLCPVLELP